MIEAYEHFRKVFCALDNVYVNIKLNCQKMLEISVSISDNLQPSFFFRFPINLYSILCVTIIFVGFFLRVEKNVS